VDQVWATDITYIPLRRGSSTWWPVWICSPECPQLETFQQPDMEILLEAWNCCLPLAKMHRSSTPIRVSVTSGDSSCKAQDRGDQDQLSGRGRCYDNIWWRDYGGSPNMRRCTCALQRWPGKLKSACPILWRYCM